MEWLPTRHILRMCWWQRVWRSCQQCHYTSTGKDDQPDLTSLDHGNSEPFKKKLCIVAIIMQLAKQIHCFHSLIHMSIHSTDSYYRNSPKSLRASHFDWYTHLCAEPSRSSILPLQESRTIRLQYCARSPLLTRFLSHKLKSLANFTIKGSN